MIRLHTHRKWNSYLSCKKIIEKEHEGIEHLGDSELFVITTHSMPDPVEDIEKVGHSKGVEEGR
jgi:hypothetical protein